jgi:hypothetical protein
MTQAQLHEWFVANGYPQKELDIWKNSENGMPCGMFEGEVEDGNAN